MQTGALIDIPKTIWPQSFDPGAGGVEGDSDIKKYPCDQHCMRAEVVMLDITCKGLPLVNIILYYFRLDFGSTLGQKLGSKTMT